MRKAISIIFSFYFCASFSQNEGTITNRPACGTMHALAERIKEDPSIAESIKKMKVEAIEQNASGKRSAMIQVTIPVVFHVVYNTAAENIPDYRLIDQLRVLNQDYRKLNTDTFKVPSVWKGIAADIQVNFCLAQRDPSGNPSSGITRTYTATTSFTDDDQVKYTAQGGINAWDKTKYLNFWVCDLGSSLLGYAQFPGGGPTATDGVVIHYKYVGTTGAYAPYDKGRTATHEIGHWLNLYHIWGDDNGACSGSDNVSDTPNQADEHYGYFADYSVQTDACSTVAPGTMWMNYMDYSDDAAMYLFTTGQKTRMQSVLAGSGFGNRTSLQTSLGCSPAAVIDASVTDIKRPESGNCNSMVSPIITLANKGSGVLTSADIVYNVDGGTLNTYSWTGNLFSGNSADVYLTPITAPSAGKHTFTVYAINPNGLTDELNSNDTLSLPFTAITPGTIMNFPFTEGFESATFPPLSWTLVNPDANLNTWKRMTVGGFAASTASAKMDNANGTINVDGRTDDLISPQINLTGSDTSLGLTFSVAHARYNSAYIDTLMIDASTDCGDSWQRVYTKWGSNLETKTAQTSAFTPNSSSQWRIENVGLGSFAGTGNILLRFRSKSGSGNNIYIDDINVKNGVTGIKEKEVQSMVIYPNPSNGSLTIENAPKDMVVNVYNTLGKWISTFTVLSNRSVIDLRALESGLYYLVGKANGNVITRTISVIR